uniref:B30.2/SPRY domain-containing protein n=1 Tax=Apteryx owenii TaxID=8824 RepID=A0A8B9PAA0_APTOW
PGLGRERREERREQGLPLPELLVLPKAGPLLISSSFSSAPETLTLLVPAEEVSLDPHTAHPQLILSEDCRSVRWGEKWQDLPHSNERFDSLFCVLGREVFTVGRHCWEVEGEVGAEPHWAVGVARESLKRKGWIYVSPDKGIWAVQYQKGKFEALTSPPTPFTQAVEILLNSEAGEVSFYNLTDRSHLFAFTSSFSEPLRPYFNLAINKGGQNATPLTICPIPA